MRIRLIFQMQFLLAVATALICGWLIGIPHTSEATEQPTEFPFQRPQPYTNVTGVWMVNVKFNKSGPPQILKVVALEEGRLTTTRGGDNYLRIVDSEEKELFELKFQVQFSAPDFGATVNEVEKVLVIPAFQSEKSIVISTQQGETRYELPTR